ncbi:hypothetical protein SAMN04488505_10787 [Chitinophaga rupis]|uniref:Uncharacterized protein n=1 Tax=Chitinophaga rupis TaxID=573321 RepID=A0A1H8CEF6_9BACT|nr:class I lanthipeptide [Chitinophaga rupis]SEM93463.1 hypothetical protein SAMN04488505_10787 [Chitinophaga rupis]
MKKQPLKKLHLGKIKIASLSRSRQEMIKGGEAMLVTFMNTCSVLCPTRLCTTPPPPEQ